MARSRYLTLPEEHARGDAHAAGRVWRRHVLASAAPAQEALGLRVPPLGDSALWSPRQSHRSGRSPSHLAGVCQVGCARARARSRCLPSPPSPFLPRRWHAVAAAHNRRVETMRRASRGGRGSARHRVEHVEWHHRASASHREQAEARARPLGQPRRGERSANLALPQRACARRPGAMGRAAASWRLGQVGTCYRTWAQLYHRIVAARERMSSTAGRSTAASAAGCSVAAAPRSGSAEGHKSAAPELRLLHRALRTWAGVAA